MQPNVLRKSAWVSVAVSAALLTGISSPEARVTRIVIDSATAIAGSTIPYQRIVGRAFGELCVAGACAGAANNQIITDINLAPTVASGGSTVVQYVSSFTIVKPVDNNNISPLGILWHDVPNRGGRITINVAEQNLGDVGLSSGWQGDNAGAIHIGTVRRPADRPRRRREGPTRAGSASR